MQRAHDVCQDFLAFATPAAGDGDRSPECRDAVSVMLRLQTWKAEGSCSVHGVGGRALSHDLEDAARTGSAELAP
eukprot:10845796-Lingulodinium_polyedra.AAC.1